MNQGLQHQLWQILLDGRLLAAPHTQIAKLLDLGCGSAVWTSAVAAQLPETQVIGVDLTPPANTFGLENLSFVTADIQEPWSFAPEAGQGYDLISLRVLVSAIHDWSALTKRCFTHLKPGGWIEIPDITIATYSPTFDWQDESSPLMRWSACYRKAAAENGIDGLANQSRAKCLADSGFTQISEKFFNCHLDADAVTESKDKEIARLAKIDLLSLLDTVTKVMQERRQWRTLGLSSSELEQLKEDAKDDVSKNGASRGYYWPL